ncbi:MAG: hypothetical protein II870_02935 [Synergistaceae bacterium]|nr:hypothetical protein [Synergistaceae bacterium]MBQ7569807.1 hypothetical protein [Synergistaceae bacterium]MBQ9581785.1 hypothetical protein [Synergistaceae bacterium]MBQ9897616.1 hypothetical protein [Synergistaceae bacterium]MBR0043508.1 hypothetical protein [Synergistaceae bacterium]
MQPYSPFLCEYDEEKERRLAQREAYEIGYEEGFKEGYEKGFKEGFEKGLEEAREEIRRAVASNMLKENMPLNLIKTISKLPEDYILSIAEGLGVSVVTQ